MRLLVVLGLLAIAPLALAAGPFGYSVQSNGNDHLYKIDMSTGASTDLGLVGLADAEGLAFKGSTLYAIGGTVEEFWNITTPPGSKVGATGARNGIDAGLAYDAATGTMFNLNGAAGGSFLYKVNTATGAATFHKNVSVFGDGLAIKGGTGYFVDWIFTDSLYKLNLATGGHTLVGNLGLGNVSAQAGVGFDGTGQLWAITSDGKTWKLNTATGAATFSANVSAGVGWEGLDIPEPTSLLLLALGGLAALRRR